MDTQHKLEMPYIGGCLSINHCYYPKTRRYKREVVDWMAKLAEKASWIPPTLRSQDATIFLSGVFRNRRCTPDLHNLHKVVADAVANGLGLATDVDFRFIDMGYRLDKQAPQALTVEVVFRQ